jgi:hypothetical protein
MSRIPRLRVTLSGNRARAYVAAARHLAAVLPHPPTAEELVQHEASGRKARTIVDDYLYCIGWFDPRRQRERARSRTALPGSSGDPSRN